LGGVLFGWGGGVVVVAYCEGGGGVRWVVAQFRLGGVLD